MVEVAIKYRSTDSPQRFRITDRAWWMLLQHLKEPVPPPSASLAEVKDWHIRRALGAHAHLNEAAASLEMSKTGLWRWRQQERLEDG